MTELRSVMQLKAPRPARAARTAWRHLAPARSVGSSLLAASMLSPEVL